MTFRQIGIGGAIGVAIAVVGWFSPHPRAMLNAGMLIIIFSIIAGGADGTLPRKI